MSMCFTWFPKLVGVLG